MFFCCSSLFSAVFLLFKQYGLKKTVSFWKNLFWKNKSLFFLSANFLNSTAAKIFCLKTTNCLRLCFVLSYRRHCRCRSVLPQFSERIVYRFVVTQRSIRFYCRTAKSPGVPSAIFLLSSVCLIFLQIFRQTPMTAAAVAAVVIKQ